MRSANKTTESNSPSAIAVTKLIADSGERQKNILELMPKDKRSGVFLSLLKSGGSKVPADYVLPLCKAVGADEKTTNEFAATVLSEYHSDILELISRIDGTIIDEDELRLIQLFRKEKKKKMLLKESEYEEKVSELQEEGASKNEILKYTDPSDPCLTADKELLKKISDSFKEALEF